jgi:N-acetylglucosaminyl-diphospho-decaprenol L-rhamnosyltransferase
MNRVAIVIVTYNSAGHVGACLDSLRGLSGIETIVVDNASADSSRSEVASRAVRLIANPNNAGFAAAVNQGVRATTAPLVLLLNPDTCLETDLAPLIAEFDNPQVGAATGLLTGADGRPQTGFMARRLPSATALIFELLGINALWPGNPVNWHYRCLDLNPVTPCFVEQPAGAFLMFSRAAWERVGGFDERYWPLWFEDVDFCCKLKQSGYFVRFNPLVAARHEGGHTAGALPLELREKYWYGSLLEYAANHYRLLGFWSICVASMIGAGLRAVRGLPRLGFKAVAVYGAVCRLAFGRILSVRARLSE